MAVVGFAGFGAFFGVEGARVGLGVPVGAAWAFAVLAGGRRVWRTVAVGIVYYPSIVSKKKQYTLLSVLGGSICDTPNGLRMLVNNGL